MKQQQTHFAFEQIVFEAFRNRDCKKTQWADGLLHIVPHEHIPRLSLHHQHSQYHQVLFWLENLFPQAAQWLGVRELARLSLDFLENNPCPSDDPVGQAENFVELLSTKRSHLHVSQLEALMRCGILCWKIRSAQWRSDLAMIPRERNFSLHTLIEHNQAGFFVSPGSWSVFDLWSSACTGKPLHTEGESDVLMIFRKNEYSLEFERWNEGQISALLPS